MVETKCIEVDNAQSSNSETNKLNKERWQALIGLHRTLLHEHHDFFLVSRHLSASMLLCRLASKYAMPARMWRHGIHSFLELLRHKPPEFFEHMLNFLYLSYSMMPLLYETVPAFEDTWIDCLGDLGCHPTPFLSARESAMTLFDPVVNSNLRHPSEVVAYFVRAYVFNVLMTAIFHKPDMADVPIEGTYALDPDPNDNEKYCNRIIAFLLSSKREFRAICNRNVCQPLSPSHPNHGSDRNTGQLLNRDHTNDPSASRLPRQGLCNIFIGSVWLLIWIASLAGCVSAWLSGAGAKGVSACRRYWKRWNVDSHGLGFTLRMEAM